MYAKNYPFLSWWLELSLFLSHIKFEIFHYGLIYSKQTEIILNGSITKVFFIWASAWLFSKFMSHSEFWIFLVSLIENCWYLISWTDHNRSNVNKIESIIVSRLMLNKYYTELILRMMTYTCYNFVKNSPRMPLYALAFYIKEWSLFKIRPNEKKKKKNSWGIC